MEKLNMSKEDFLMFCKKSYEKDLATYIDHAADSEVFWYDDDYKKLPYIDGKYELIEKILGKGDKGYLDAGCVTSLLPIDELTKEFGNEIISSEGNNLANLTSLRNILIGITYKYYLEDFLKISCDNNFEKFVLAIGKRGKIFLQDTGCIGIYYDIYKTSNHKTVMITINADDIWYSGDSDKYYLDTQVIFNINDFKGE